MYIYIYIDAHDVLANQVVTHSHPSNSVLPNVLLPASSCCRKNAVNLCSWLWFVAEPLYQKWPSEWIQGPMFSLGLLGVRFLLAT